jgi:hypothetical protein
MKRNSFFRLLARLRVGRKLLLIYLLDLMVHIISTRFARYARSA